MKNILFLALFVAVFTHSVVADDSEINPVIYGRLKDLDNNSFGKTMIDTVAVQMGAGSPADDLIQLLQEIEDQIRAEQDSDDEYIKKLQEECDDDLAKLEAQVEKATSRIAELKALLDELIPQRQDKQDTLERKTQNKEDLEAALATLVEKKALKDQEWKEEQEQHDKAFSVIVQAKTIIQEASASFLQKGSSALVQVSQKVKAELKTATFKRQSWNTFFNLLAEVSQDLGPQANQDTVQKVIDICDDILDRIAESRAIERKDYNNWVDEYQVTVDGLQAKLDKVNGAITVLNSEIAALDKRIADSQLEKKEQEQRRKDKQQQHDERLQFCDDENKAYFERRQSRDDQRSVVSQTIGLLQANLRTFRRYVKDRINQ